MESKKGHLMQITSNDTIQLEAFYNELKSNRVDDVKLKKVQLEDSMGVLPTIEIKSSDFTSMIKEIFIAWLEYKKFKLYIDSEEVKIEDFDKINEETKIDIEFDER